MRIHSITSSRNSNRCKALVDQSQKPIPIATNRPITACRCARVQRPVNSPSTPSQRAPGRLWSAHETHNGSRRPSSTAVTETVVQTPVATRLRLKNSRHSSLEASGLASCHRAIASIHGFIAGPAVAMPTISITWDHAVQHISAPAERQHGSLPVEAQVNAF